MSDTETLEQPQQQTAQPEKLATLADVISAKVEEIARKKSAPEQPSPAARKIAPSKQEAAAQTDDSDEGEADVSEKKETPRQRQRRQRVEKAAVDAVLPPEESEESDSSDDSSDDSETAQIDEALSKSDKTDGIKQLRGAYEQSKKRVADLENQLKQVQNSPKAPEDYETLKKQVQEYSAELERVALERHPEFRKKFGSQMESLDSAAKKLVGNLQTSVTPEEFTALLSSPASDAKTARINELIEGASPLVTSKIANLVSNYETLQEQRSSLLEQHSQTLKDLDMQQRAEIQQRLEREQSGFEQVMNDLSQNYEYLKPVEGNADWNGFVNQIKSAAKNLYFSEKDPAKLMQATVMAAMAEPYRQAYLAKNSENKALKAKLAAIESAAPSFDGGKGKAKNSDSDDWDDKKDYASNLAERIASRGGLGGRV